MPSAQKLIASLVTILLLAGPSLCFYESRVYNGSAGWSARRHIGLSPPLVLASNRSLVHVLDSGRAGRPLLLESTEFQPCAPALRLDYPSRYPRRAASLGNGKLVVWLLNYRTAPGRRLAEWRFVVVEPRGCTSRDLTLRDSERLPIDVVGVVGYRDSFDVLIAGPGDEEPRYTYVYRYDDEGNPVSSFNVSAIPDLDSKPFYRPNTIRLHAAKEHDPTAGYFYLQLKPATSTSVVKRLDSSFTLTGSTKLNHSKQRSFAFNAYSTHRGNFSVCRYYERKRTLHCLLLNTRLRLIAEAKLSHGTLGQLALINMPGGAVLLAFGMRTGRRQATPIYLQRIGSDGAASPAALIGRVHCEIYGLEGFEMGDGLYCVVVTCDEVVHTRCVEVR